jgi:hypothetical protein
LSFCGTCGTKTQKDITDSRPRFDRKAKCRCSIKL